MVTKYWRRAVRRRGHTHKSVGKLPMPRASWKGTREHVVVHVEFQKSIVAQIGVISWNGSRKLIVIHVKMFQDNHIHTRGQFPCQGIVTEIKVKHFVHTDTAGQGSTELIIVQIEVTCTKEETQNWSAEGCSHHIGKHPNSTEQPCQVTYANSARCFETKTRAGCHSIGCVPNTIA